MNHKIILASGSPRRRELMALVGAEYIVIPSNKEEDMSDKNPRRLVEGLSKMKAADIAERIIAKSVSTSEVRFAEISDSELKTDYMNSVIIGCDTVVAYDNKILGKPHSEEEAFKMIRDFCGGDHYVYTGVCLIVIENGAVKNTVNYSVETAVSVADMTDKEIFDYIASGESMDKAGAYAIQGRFCPFITGIKGDYYNIVGYPINSIYTELKKLGIRLF